MLKDKLIARQATLNRALTESKNEGDFMRRAMAAGVQNKPVGTSSLVPNGNRRMASLYPNGYGTQNLPTVTPKLRR